MRSSEVHTTIVKLKTGEIYEGPISYFRPCFNWFTLFGVNKQFSFDECESVITPNERVRINSPMEGEPQDEMLRAKSNLDAGRKYGWKEDGQPYPQEKFEWEKRYDFV